MHHALKLHPDSRCEAVTGIEVVFTRPQSNVLLLHYTAIGKVQDVLLAPLAAPERKDELWRTTCFEAFLILGDDYDYSEFNFAPSTAWAAYRFKAYREGMTQATDLKAPRITVQSKPGQFDLTAELEFPHQLWDIDRIALTAVIEETNGRKSYWALAHPPGKPDFHHIVGFVLDLANKRYE